MALYNYLTSRSDRGHVRRSTNVVDLMNRAKSEEKKEKRYNLVITAAAISALAISGIIIAL